MKERGRTILQKDRFKITVHRLCHQIIENYPNVSDLCIIGVQPRGIFLSNRIHQVLSNMFSSIKIDYGKLDITFHRDDFRIRDKPIQANNTEINFLVEDKNVILIDDVLYTGRTIQAALSAIQHYGRPKKVELLTLVDRRFNRHLPIQSDYTGLTVDALDQAYIKVCWEENEGKDQILIFSNKVD